MNQKIAITKTGCISHKGIGCDEFKKNMQLTSEASEIKIFEIEKYDKKKAYVMNDFDPKTILGEKGLRNLNRNTYFILSTIKKDFDNEIEYFKSNGLNLGLTIGTAFGSLASISDYELEIFEKTPRKINPMGFANTVLNSPTSRANIWFDLTASSTTISSGSVSGAKALEFSMNQLKSGNVDAVLCGGAEELNMQTFLGYYLNGFLSDKDGIQPYGDNDGVIISEGCAMALLETVEMAKKRNAGILGVIEGYGYGFSGSVDNVKNFDGVGMKKSIEMALADADTSINEIDIIISSANGIKVFDKMEEKVMTEMFGENLENIPIIPLKAITGENIGAYNLFQLVYSLYLKEYTSFPIICKYDKTVKKIVKDNNYQINTSKIRKILLNCSSECGNHSAVIINLGY